MDIEKSNETFEKIQNKYGSYHSLIKDIKLLKFFMNHPNKEIRQKTMSSGF